MIDIFTSPLFYLFLTLGIYTLFAFPQKKLKTPLLIIVLRSFYSFERCGQPKRAVTCLQAVKHQVSCS